MPPQTRSRGNSSGNVTYKSTSAAPKQKLFPARRKQVKTYGRPRAARKDLKQETLTQMAFVTPSMPEDEDLLIPDDEDENDIEELEAPASVEDTKPKDSKKRSRGSRRKTAGDELVADEKPRGKKRRKTLGDPPSTNPSSSFHTQTLTQFLSNKGDEEEEVWKLNDSEDDDNAGIIAETPTKPKVHASSNLNEIKSEQRSGVRSSVPSLVTSATPTNREKREIPSSTAPSTPTIIRFHPGPEDTPLKGRSTNFNAPYPVIKQVKVIPDSFSTAHSSPTTAALVSSVKATPHKELRFQIPEDKENITPGRTKPKSPKPPRKTPIRSPLKEVHEIPDSVYDSDEIQDMEGGEGTGADQPILAELEGDNIPATDDPEEAETYYGVIGDETQAELLSSAEELSHELGESDSEESSRSRSPTPTPKPKQKQVAHMIQATSTPTGPSTSAVDQSYLSSPTKKPSDEDLFKAQTQFYTQGLESQRLPLEDIRALGPLTSNSDIMVSLHPKFLEKILSREKDHEFRPWKIPPGVSRIWIYSAKPHCELKYMCILSPPKVPGEIEDERGIGNAEFNQEKRCARYAYEILQVYELNNPVSLGEMIEKGWLKAAPRGYVLIPPAAAGELTANLKCALFGNEEQDADAALVASSPIVTESQELKAQLQSDVDYSTQHHSPENVDEVIPSSQSPRRSTRKNQTKNDKEFAKPAVPRLISGSSAQSLPGPSSQRPHGPVRPSQATTVSSPGVSPEKSLPQAITISSEPSAHTLHSSSPTAFRNTRNSLRSSQLMTRSQMLPDSLMNNEIQNPPSIIWDSADEQSD
ncbi:hypothetical protein F4776DRAFT_633118 [Hypoxylon sp. NC0597]|nr:hypothetical protein F4776DRAFT_633118 [Hypoxylon sp. NC0597]